MLSADARFHFLRESSTGYRLGGRPDRAQLVNWRPSAPLNAASAAMLPTIPWLPAIGGIASARPVPADPRGKRAGGPETDQRRHGTGWPLTIASALTATSTSHRALIFTLPPAALLLTRLSTTWAARYGSPGLILHHCDMGSRRSSLSPGFTGTVGISLSIPKAGVLWSIRVPPPTGRFQLRRLYTNLTLTQASRDTEHDQPLDCRHCQFQWL